ncbi:alpha/beta hydrolase [Nesterenkonia lutea]|uniref:Pimeloyl-ACP methyl ester carboxylesterase n=1 Tax=Nesterenkonia lutea TaxID=272919 RepID=A0ABR9JBD0_9MICC|nr:alpha/beta hydrolase [Nesterenkonia lutea]MBE1523238.1 pimeloyl-ACP methyl ester carboxylesterase [Nesterenkonia lutea]
MPENPLFPRGLRLAGLAAAAALLLSGCATPGDESDSAASSAVEGTTDEESMTATTVPADALPGDAGDYTDYYEQELEWSSCEDTMMCADVTVPMDYEDPGAGEDLEIRIISSETGGEDEYLLTNPGGPGSSGYNTVADTLTSAFSEELVETYNVVGFDPRGVHRSSPVTCLDDAEMDEYRQQVSDEQLDTDAAYAEARESAAELAAQCEAESGDLLVHVDTLSAARDMDVIRAALGQDELDYLGFSYGTKLGLTYAEHYGQRVGRFVLDGMFDVSIEAHELNTQQALGFEDALENYAQWCTEQENCAAGDTVDEVVQSTQDLFAEVDEEPVQGADGRTINVSTLVSGFITPLYNQLSWPVLSEALNMALSEDDFSAFQYFADLQSGRSPDGNYDWINSFAFTAVMCLDYPMPEDPEQIEAEFEEVSDQAPTFGPYLGHRGVVCQEWPAESVAEPWDPGLTEVEEILFIGTTGDPATPVEWAENMHESVPQSSLIIREGEGHLGYQAGNDCVDDAVDGYLLGGDLAEGRTEC